MPEWKDDAVGLAARLRRRDISARAVVEAHLNRIAEVEPHLAAFITVAGEQALQRAADLDAAPEPLGPLHGLPVAVKDLTDTAGVRTTFGSAVFRDHVPVSSDLVVERMERAGAIMIGKTNTPEFGFGAVCANALKGPTRNPHDVRLTSGGSSGGSAVSVATGMAPLAHGTDFGGSVRTPAGFCGVVSLRPTPGTIPSPSRALGWDTLATHGTMARTVADVGLLFDALRIPDPRDPTSGAAAFSGRRREAPRIGATPDFGVAPVAASVRNLFERTVETVARRHGTVARTAPDCAEAIPAFRTLRAAQVHHAFGKLADRVEPTVRWNIEAGKAISAETYLDAQAARTRLYRRFVDLFDGIDILMAPAAGVQPWINEHGEVTAIDGKPLDTVIDYLAVTFIVSLVGFPVLTLPSSVTDGAIPFGVQLIARPGEEAMLLDFGASLERELGFRHRWPSEPFHQSTA
jgi:amidase